ncbi:MAG: hypothetical protein J4400_00565 [Candidatus Aenigmarchaeota archaeon]|nr:hypothetical protein [Candidatus Aenigmarchaeota archaeon]
MAVTKRYHAPKFWTVKTKEKECIRLGRGRRDILGHARTMNEAKKILLAGVIRVNDTVRKEHGFPVGLMDTVDVGGDFYRVVPSKKGLALYKTEQSHIRLAKITNKTSVKKGKLQLNFHDGTNMLVDKDNYKTSDVVSIDTAHNTIKDTVKFEKGSFAVVTGGNNTGFKGTIESIDRKLKTVIIAGGEKKLPVPIRYVFVVGRDAPIVNIG